MVMELPKWGVAATEAWRPFSKEKLDNSGRTTACCPGAAEAVKEKRSRETMMPSGPLFPVILIP
jgi:hypothetical protein